MSDQPDVVVVGGGPVGLLVASELALRGVAVTLVERLTETIDQPKAGTLHARAAQSLRRRGYLPAGPLEGPPGAVARSPFHFAAQRTFEISSPLAEGAPVVARWQGDLERFLEAVCLARGVRVLRGTRVAAIDPGANGARLELESERDGPSVLTPGWVVGADGARSIVRRAAGIGATDQPATLRALLGRLTLTDPGRAPVGWHETPRGWTLVNRAIDPDGTSRLITFEFGVQHADRAEPVSAEELRATVERIRGEPLPFDDLTFSGRFSDFSRLADTYRSGRILLAGDAAHVHYPVGGQGLNLGIQDAFNVAWKLAAVIRGGADQALLDTYTAERRPYAQRVIDYTREQAVAMDPRPERAAERAILLQHVDGGPRQAALAAMVSSQDVRTWRARGEHEAVGTFAVDRAVRSQGEPTRLSALLAGGRGVLLAPAALAFGDRIRHGWRGRVDVVVDDLQPDATLVRPDGYVAWAAGQAVALRHADEARLLAALTRWFGPEAGTAPRERVADRAVVAAS